MKKYFILLLSLSGIFPLIAQDVLAMRYDRRGSYLLDGHSFHIDTVYNGEMQVIRHPYGFEDPIYLFSTTDSVISFRIWNSFKQSEKLSYKMNERSIMKFFSSPDFVYSLDSSWVKESIDAKENVQFEYDEIGCFGSTNYQLNISYKEDRIIGSFLKNNKFVKKKALSEMDLKRLMIFEMKIKAYSPRILWDSTNEYEYTITTKYGSKKVNAAQFFDREFLIIMKKLELYLKED
ncbi:MAG: hypothetical protein N4A45_12660 [Flavobacteriales bacterium]|jgi:hypothetical protein|nr:hypothetical protein [Flavobacteriales bacterium]